MPSKPPQHLAIIMDGNGRWAKERGLARIEGHRKGTEVAEDIINLAQDHHISYLTLYAFSDENWNRPKDEVDNLMVLLDWFLKAKQEKMVKNGIRFEAIGDLQKLPNFVQQRIEETKEMTRNGKSMTLILALSYGSRGEIIQAVNQMKEEGKAGPITEEIFSSYLNTKHYPDPDLLIRTSGEFRISNFLLWQLAYTELYFTRTMWPDFNADEFKKALDEFSKRERRFGKTSEQLI